jgi:hypothetical protein
MVAIHSRGDAGGRQIEMKGAGDVREQMRVESRRVVAANARFMQTKQSDRIDYILNLPIDYDTWLC